MKREYYYFISFVALIFVFISCDQNRVYEKNIAVNEKGWNKDSVITFDLSITDTLQNHNFYINVRNDIKYKYSNLWLFIEIDQPGGSSLTDTFEITLADQAGKWLGEGFGGVKSQQIIYKKNVYFPVSGDYKIDIAQGMREDELKWITDIGIRIEKKE